MEDSKFEEVEKEEEKQLRIRLQEAAFNLIYNDGIRNLEEWTDELINQYPDLVSSVYGDDYPTTVSILKDMWNCGDYTEPITGYCFSFLEWAEYFSNGGKIFLELQEALRNKGDFYKNIIDNQHDTIVLLEEKVKFLEKQIEEKKNVNYG